MKRRKLKKKWKVLLCLIILGVGFYIYNLKTSNSNVENLSNKSEVKRERVTVGDKKIDEVVVEEENVEEKKVSETVRETAEVGFFPMVENFTVSLKGAKHSSSGYYFYMDEDIDASISGDYLEGTIYVIKHGNEIRSIYEYGETVKDTTFNNSIFFINYEEGNIGYYDAIFVSNEQVVGYVTFEIVD